MLRLLAHPQKELQLNLKTNNTQNCQKIKLYGSPTTKDLKKPQTSQTDRRGGDMETGGKARRRGVAQRVGSGGEMGVGDATFTCGG